MSIVYVVSSLRFPATGCTTNAFSSKEAARQVCDEQNSTMDTVAFQVIEICLFGATA